MKIITRYSYLNLFAAIFCCLAPVVTGCKDGKSYSDMLRDEKGAVNWYLAQNRVEPRVPEDSVFQTGEDAPFYRMNSDGTVYMRVIRQGDMNNRPVKGDNVYFRFMRYDISQMYDDKTTDITGYGNTEDMFGNSDWHFVYGNTTLPSTTQFGTGIQLPLNYLGYGCEVDLIVKSTEGMSVTSSSGSVLIDDVSNCTPYVYKNLKYFKAEY